MHTIQRKKRLCPNEQTSKEASKQTNKPAKQQSSKQTNNQTTKQTNKQTNKQAMKRATKGAHRASSQPLGEGRPRPDLKQSVPDAQPVGMGSQTAPSQCSLEGWRITRLHCRALRGTAGILEGCCGVGPYTGTARRRRGPPSRSRRCGASRRG
jgi:hypothetical protein